MIDFLGASREQAIAMRPDWDVYEADAFGSTGRLLGVVAGLCDTAFEAEAFFLRKCPEYAERSLMTLRSRADPTWSEYVRS